MGEFPTQWSSFRHNGRVSDTMGEFPTQWANSIIISIFKKGDSENPSNYRGITLMGVPSNALHKKTVSKATCLHLYTKYIQMLNIVLTQQKVVLNRVRVPLVTTRL